MAKIWRGESSTVVVTADSEVVIRDERGEIFDLGPGRAWLKIADLYLDGYRRFRIKAVQGKPIEDVEAIASSRVVKPEEPRKPNAIVAYVWGESQPLLEDLMSRGFSRADWEEFVSLIGIDDEARAWVRSNLDDRGVR